MRNPPLLRLRLPTAMTLPRPTDFQGKIIDSPYLASADPNASLYAYDEEDSEEGCPCGPGECRCSEVDWNTDDEATEETQSETAEDNERSGGDVQPVKAEPPAVQEAAISSTAPPTPAADPRREAQWKFHKDSRFNDLRLVVDEQEFHVNSLVMATESEFFSKELHKAGKLELTNAADRTILAVENEAEELREFVADFFRCTPDFRLDFLLSARVGELLTADPPLAVRVHQFVKSTLQPASP
ncbi:hypothetical protein M3Y99_00823700 [Aphelenchoides fujianensis]|nr:hypothetical protein M3Y99_00823700 [Aphelenchoides fujianensis]